jgi:hypothetical protein
LPDCLRTRVTESGEPQACRSAPLPRNKLTTHILAAVAEQELDGLGQRDSTRAVRFADPRGGRMNRRAHHIN